MTKLMRSRRMLTISGLALAMILLSVPAAQAMKIKSQNLKFLITDSQSIVFGTVSKVSDGIDKSGVPYTEVTMQVGTSAKGKIKDGESFSFRQFGLLEPRNMGNGKVYLAVSPQGFPRWHEGETVMAFLRKPASRTGLQTTAGMGQGKLTLINNKLVNEYQNSGMFDGMEIDKSRLSSEQQNMLINPLALDHASFMELVGRAVSEQWIEKGVMK